MGVPSSVARLAIVLAGCARTAPPPRQHVELPVEAEASAPSGPSTPEAAREDPFHGLVLQPAWTPAPPAAPLGKPFAVAGAVPERCAIRVTGARITVDGDDATRAQAVAKCRGRKAALVELGDVHDQATWRGLKADLEAARVPILMRGRRADAPDCLYNPLALGCL